MSAIPMVGEVYLVNGVAWRLAIIRQSREYERLDHGKYHLLRRAVMAGTLKVQRVDFRQENGTVYHGAEWVEGGLGYLETHSVQAPSNSAVTVHVDSTAWLGTAMASRSEQPVRLSAQDMEAEMAAALAAFDTPQAPKSVVETKVLPVDMAVDEAELAEHLGVGMVTNPLDEVPYLEKPNKPVDTPPERFHDDWARFGDK